MFRVFYSLAMLFAVACCYADTNEVSKTSEIGGDTAVSKVDAADILASCTRMLPAESLVVDGSIRVRKPRGIVLEEFPYRLLIDWGSVKPSAEIHFLSADGTRTDERATLVRKSDGTSQIAYYRNSGGKVETPHPAARVRGTDLTWLDLSLDFLWWKSVRFDDTWKGESRNGRDCYIILAAPPAPIPGCSAMRIWVDCKLRCFLQAEQLGPQGNVVRRFWVQRVKKFNDRWMIKDMQVETINSGHRTQLLVNHAVAP